MAVKFLAWGLLAAVAAVAAALYAVYSGQLAVPERFNPWAPLRIADTPGPLTAFKLQRASADPQLCRAVLAGSGVVYQRVADRETGQGCGFANAVRVAGIVTSSGGKVAAAPFVLSCRSAVSLAMWERHVLQPAAQLHFRQPVSGIDHLGSYACRNIYHRDNASRSQHATADALDVSGFRLAGGKRISVLRDWSGNDTAPPEARFLHAVHGGACQWFEGVLGPGYNAAHRDHFHLDRGRYRVCR